MSSTGFPIPGTPAYWTAQREAVALVNAWQRGNLIPDEELTLLRRIAARRLAACMMAALGFNVDRLTAAVLRLPGLFGEDVGADDGAEYDNREDDDGYDDHDGNGEDAGADGPLPTRTALCFWNCGAVSTDAQCCLCRDLQRHAQGPAVHTDRENSVMQPQ